MRSEEPLLRTWLAEKFLKREFALARALVLVGLLFGMTGGAGAASITPRSSDQIEGSSIGVMERYLLFEPQPAESRLIADDIINQYRAAGIKWCRFILDWPYFERSPGVYETAALDILQTNISKLSAAGIQSYLCLSKTNPIYQSNTFNAYYAPTLADTTKLAAWLNFVGWVVTRLGGSVHTYEIWNEPNFTDSWLPAPNSADYAELVKQTSQKIKSMDAAANIILGGTALVDIPFIRGCFDHGVGSFIDKVGIHPYRPIPEHPQSEVLAFSPNPDFDFSYASSQAEMAALRTIIDAHRPGLGIWITEVCFISDSRNFTSVNLFHTYNSETTQAKYLLREYLTGWKYGVEQITWTLMHEYQSLTRNQDDPDWYENFLSRPVEDMEFAMGLVRTPPLQTVALTGGNSGTALAWPLQISAPDHALYHAGTFLGVSGSAQFLFTLPSAGLYTFWGHVTGTAAPNAFLTNFNLTSDFRYLVSNTHTAWAAAFGNNYPYLFNLPAGANTLYVFGDTPGSWLDQLRVVHVNAACQRKPAYGALQRLCALVDAQVATITVAAALSNVSVPAVQWPALTQTVFLDSRGQDILFGYWLGQEAVDDYPAAFLNLTLTAVPQGAVELIDPMADSITPVQTFSTVGDQTFFQHLPIADYPIFLRFQAQPILSVTPTPTPGITASPQGEGMSPRVFPSPYSRSGGGSGITFAPIAEHSQISIYNVAGELLCSAKDLGPGHWTWDIKRAGVSPGIYFYLIRDGQGRINRGRLAIVP